MPTTAQLSQQSLIASNRPYARRSALDLGDEPAGLLYAVNRTYADQGQRLAEGTMWC
jgi:hypothetical protein